MLIDKIDNWEVYLPKDFQAYKKISVWGELFDNIQENQFYIFINKVRNITFGYNFYNHFVADENNCVYEPDIFLKDKPDIKKFIDSKEDEINNLIFDILKKLYIKNKPDYKKIKKDIVSIIKTDEEVDLNFVIPARGRIEFSKPLFESFEEARKNSNKKISFTFVEHAVYSQHGKFFKNKDANYLFIQCNEETIFNKCLAYNIGAFFGPKSKYILFHDLDIVVQKDFFTNLFLNIEKNKTEAIQCYTGRRVLFCNQELSKQIINKEILIEDLNKNFPGISPPMSGDKISTGSKGGSILVTNELFKKVGGFDSELFEGYAAEDQVFWDKLEQFNTVHYADDPQIEIFHLWHPPMHGDLAVNLFAEGGFKAFNKLTKKQKIELIDFKNKLSNGDF